MFVRFQVDVLLFFNMGSRSDYFVLLSVILQDGIRPVADVLATAFSWDDLMVGDWAGRPKIGAIRSIFASDEFQRIIQHLCWIEQLPVFRDQASTKSVLALQVPAIERYIVLCQLQEFSIFCSFWYFQSIRFFLHALNLDHSSSAQSLQVLFDAGIQYDESHPMAMSFQKIVRDVYPT
jgi:hypothetical protein